MKKSKVKPVDMSGYIKTNFSLSKLQARGVLRAIDAIRELFGPKGEYWIKGDFKDTSKSFDRFCLVGAAREVNGPYEPAARLALSLAVDAVKGEISQAYRRDLSDGYILEDASENNVTTWNDSTPRTWEDILNVIAKAKRIVKKAANGGYPIY